MITQKYEYMRRWRGRAIQIATYLNLGTAYRTVFEIKFHSLPRCSSINFGMLKMAQNTWGTRRQLCA